MSMALYRLRYVKMADLTSKEADILFDALPPVDYPAIERYIPDALDIEDYSDIRGCSKEIAEKLRKLYRLSDSTMSKTVAIL